MPKKLYLAENMTKLKELTNCSSQKLNGVSIKSCCSAASRLFNAAQAAFKSGDEEQAYVYYMRFMGLYEIIRLRSEYKQNKDFYDCLLGACNFSLAITNCERLHGDLKRRYELSQCNVLSGRHDNHSTQRNVPSGFDDNNIIKCNTTTLVSTRLSTCDAALSTTTVPSRECISSNPLFSSAVSTEDSNVRLISCEQLHALICQLSSSYLILDIRPVNQFESSRIRSAYVINICPELLHRGVTAATIEKSLPGEHQRSLFARRSTVDYLIVVNWTDTEVSVADKFAPSHCLIEALCCWDLHSRTAAGRVSLLSGGYQLWMHSYPLLCTKTRSDQSQSTHSDTSAPNCSNNNHSTSSNQQNIHDQFLRLSHEYKLESDLCRELQKKENFLITKLNDITLENETSRKNEDVLRDRNIKLQEELDLLRECSLRSVTKSQTSKNSEIANSPAMSDTNDMGVTDINCLDVSEIASTDKISTQSGDTSNQLHLENVVSNILSNNAQDVSTNIFTPSCKDMLSANDVVPPVTGNDSCVLSENTDPDDCRQHQLSTRTDHRCAAESRSRSLKRYHSSPNVDNIGLNDDDPKPVSNFPFIDRHCKPDVARLCSKSPVSYQAARPRRFDPVYGSVGVALCGLRNLGNTCYMNAVIQCLSNSPAFSDFFVRETYLQFLRERDTHLKACNHTDDSRDDVGCIAHELAAIIKTVWSGHVRSISPFDLKLSVDKRIQIFQGNGQHDSHEFLVCLLDQLHEDLNEIQIKHPLKEQKNEDIPEKQAAHEFWSDFTRCNKSFVLNLFWGQLKSCVQCSLCNFQSIKFEAFSHLSLPIPANRMSSKCYLNDCLKTYMQGDRVTGWKCGKCGNSSAAIKSFSIWRLPPILIIHLQRFYNDGLWRKKQSSVDFPLQNLTMSHYVINDEAFYKNHKYQLYAIVNHYGSMQHGHYTASCLHPRTSIWHCFDDHQVTRIQNSDIQSPAVYMLMYTAVDSSL